MLAGALDGVDLFGVLGRAQVHDHVGGGDEFEPGLGQRTAAGVVEVVLLDADALRAVQGREQLGQPVGLRRVVERLAERRGRRFHAVAIERRRDQRTATTAPHRDAEEALELQPPEAGEVRDRGVLGGEDGVEAGVLQQAVERGNPGIV